MKKLRFYLPFFLMLLLQTLRAQIVISGRPQVNNVDCNRVKLGTIIVNVVQTHPPYSYSWNTGQTTNGINELEAGDYTVKITDALGADTTITFKIIELECQLDPEIFFTPNGDGINDRWGITYAQHFDDALILVYNKLGQKVFEFNGRYEYEDWWDGTDLFGKPLPTSTYYYVIYSDRKNKDKLRKGTLSIIR